LPGQRFVLGQDTVLIQGRKVTNKYLYLALQSPFLRSQIDTLSTGSTFKRINLRDIRSLLIPLPDDRMMARAVSFVDQQQTLENVARQQNEVLKALLRQLSTVIVSSNGQQP
jgi:type I restriction enzyme S subunit